MNVKQASGKVSAPVKRPHAGEQAMQTTNLTCFLYFVKIGEPTKEDLISSHSATSWFECGSKCLENQECIAFSHLDEHGRISSHRTNCKLAKNILNVVVVNGEGAWTTYRIRSTGLVRLTICISFKP